MDRQFVSTEEAISKFEDRLDDLLYEADILEVLICDLHRGKISVEEAHDDYVERVVNDGP